MQTTDRRSVGRVGQKVTPRERKPAEHTCIHCKEVTGLDGAGCNPASARKHSLFMRPGRVAVSRYNESNRGDLQRYYGVP